MCVEVLFLFARFLLAVKGDSGYSGLVLFKRSIASDFLCCGRSLFFLVSTLSC